MTLKKIQIGDTEKKKRKTLHQREIYTANFMLSFYLFFFRSIVPLIEIVFSSFFYWYFKILLHTGNLIANEINFHAIFHQPKKFIYDNYFNYTNLLHLMKQYDKQTTSFQFFLLFSVFLYHLNMQNKFWRE